MHYCIAEVLTRRPGPSPRFSSSTIATGGEPLAAAEFAVTGGRSAAERLAFDRAAELFKLAMELRSDRNEDWSIRFEEAQALANGGRTLKLPKSISMPRQKANGCSDARRNFSGEGEGRRAIPDRRLPDQGYSMHLRDVFADLKLPFPAGAAVGAVHVVKNRLRFWWQLTRGQRARIGRRFRPRAFSDWTRFGSPPRYGHADYVVGEAMTSWYLTEVARHRDRSRLLRALALKFERLRKYRQPLEHAEKCEPPPMG